LKPGERDEELLRVLGACIAAVALVILVFASTVPWGNLYVKTKVGPIPVSLKADVFEYGINYEANLNGSQLMLGGGNIPKKIADKKVFLTGLGAFQETIGFVKGTSKEKVAYGSVYTWPPPENGTAELKITTLVKTIPWWPVGIAQDAGMTFEMIGGFNFSELKVEKLTFELHRTIDGQDRYKVVYSSSPGDVLTKTGDKKTFWAKITVDEDIGEFSLVGKFELGLKDKFGNTNSTMFFPPSREVRLWTMSTDRTVRIGLMVAAFPMTLTGVAILAVGAFMGLAGRGRPRAGRWAWKLCLAGSVLVILAVIFYVLGINALIDLTGYLHWFKWGPNFSLAIIGAVLSSVPGALLFLVRPPPEPEKKNDKAPKAVPGTVQKTGPPAAGNDGARGGPAIKPAKKETPEPIGEAAPKAP